MPTILSTSADRFAISRAEFTPCAFIASLNCAPIDLTGLSAFIALCMTTDRSFHLIAVIDASVRPTRFLPLNVTLPPTISAGDDSSWATANSIVDLPQPDSPTTATNSPDASEKLTLSTASTLPASIRYSTDRFLTSSMAPDCGLGALSATSGARLAGLPGTLPPYWPKCGVADLVERVVQQREGSAERDDAKAGCDDPQRLAGLECLVVLGRAQHGAPSDLARIA